MNKKTLILILITISPIHTNAMELQPSLSAFLTQKIFTISSLCSTGTNLRDAAITVNALARVDKFLNAFINDDERTLRLIKQFSDMFGYPNMGVAKMLCTKAGNHRVDRQKAFFVSWDASQFSKIERNMNRLKGIGFDLNFTYNHHQPTALIQAMKRQGIIQGVRIAHWLIKNGADINALTARGKNAGMLALMSTDRELMHRFLDHPAFKVNHQDSEKHTSLHCCFYHERIFQGNPRIDKSRAPFIYEIVKKLLEKGANPIAMNNDGKTPLAFAQGTSYQPLIDLLQKAADKFESTEK